MRKIIALISATLLFSFHQILAQESVGIGTINPNPNSILDLSPNSPLGFLMSRLNPDDTLVLGSIPSNTGMMFYDTIAQSFRYFDGTNWVEVGTGAGGGAGADGKTILNGTSDPLGTDGVDGDFYINTTSTTIFGPKSGTWPTGVPLIGAAGADGLDGDRYATISTDNRPIQLGPLSITVATGLAYTFAQTVIIANSGADFMEGSVDTYNPSTGQLDVTVTSITGGPGPFSSWSVNISGAPGPAGTDGNTILSGSGVPGAGIGTNGDFYIDTDIPVLYGPKTLGAWPSPGDTLIGADGIAGLDGNTILSGVANPTGGDGGDGDFFINTATDSIFGPKTAGAWGAPTSLVGPAGNTILNGTGVPANGIGNNGDFFIDTNAEVIYGPKTAGAWPTPGDTLIIAAGANDTIPANVFSARVDQNGNLISSSYDFIQSVTRVGVGAYDIVYKPGFFTTIPSVNVTSNAFDPGVVFAGTQNESVNGFRVLLITFTGAVFDDGFNFVVQRQGLDYQNTLTAPPNVVGYWQSNGDDVYVDTAQVGIGTNNPTGELTIATVGGTEIQFQGAANNADIDAPGQMNIQSGTSLLLSGSGQAGLQGGTTNVNVNSDGVGIDQSPNANASLALGGNTKGLQLNRVDTTTLQPSLGPADRGIVVYDTTDNEMYVWNGTRFTLIGSASGSTDTIPANVFSARIDGQAATPDANRISTSNANFIQSVTRTGTGSYDIVFISGFFTVDPSINATVLNSGGSRAATVISSSFVSATIIITDVVTATNNNEDFAIIVQRQGADYQNTLTAPPNVVGYWQSNGTDIYVDTAAVGIGTSTPTQLLDVVGGNINIDASSAYLQGGGHLISQVAASQNVYVGGNTNAATGSNNTVVGFDAGNTIGAGVDNTVMGYRAGQTLGSGNSNTMIGKDAGSQSFNTSRNTFIGELAGEANFNGQNNTMVGRNTGASNTSGNAITLLGTNADATDGLTNATAIGAGAVVGASNALVLGNGAISVGIGTQTPANKLEVIGDAAKFDSVIIVNGAQVGYVLTAADATGAASWQPIGASTFWDLTGNASTVDGTNFIGTTDDVPLNFRMFNQPSGRIDDVTSGYAGFGYESGNSGAGFNNSAFGFRALATNTADGNTALGALALENNVGSDANTGIGYAALRSITGTQNTAVGNAAMENSSTANNNVAVGYAALLNTDSDGNTAVGSQAMQSSSTGGNNVAVGFSALFNNEANANTAIGSQALAGNDAGSGNTAVGERALTNNIGGLQNTAMGLTALFNNDEGDQNVGIGFDALFTNTTGNNNVGIGWRAGFDLNGGSNNVFIGYDANAGNININNSVALGFNAVVSQDNSIVLGDIANARVGIRTSTPNDVLDVNGPIYIEDLGAAPGVTTSRLYHNSGDLYWQGTNLTQGASVWTTDGVDAWRVSGNVGIGTFLPENPLHIQGTDPTVDGSSGVWMKLDNQVTGTNSVSTGILFDTYNGDTEKGGIFFRRNSSFGRGDLLFSTNNNADAGSVDASDTYARMTIASTGNVGIGTTTPSQTLHVASEGLGAQSNMLLEGHSVTATRGPGINLRRSKGTIASPVAVINGDYLGGLLISGRHGSGYAFASGITSEVDGVVSGTSVPGNLIFSTTQAGNGFPNERMRISSIGDVGIGITNPNAKLHVNSGPVATALRLDNTVAGNTIFDVYNNGTLGTRYQTTSGQTNILSQSTRDINFWTNGFSRMTIDGVNGRVGIGTTTPAFNLSVNGSANLNEGIASGAALWVNGSEALWYNGTYFSWGFGGSANFFADNVGLGTPTPVNRLDVEGGVAIGAAYSGTNTSPTNGLIVEGNVGIGTSAPSFNMDVVGGVTGAENILALFRTPGTTTGQGTGIRLGNTTNANGALGYADLFAIRNGAGEFSLRPGGTEIMRATTTGVGIGTSTPTARLEVDGGTTFGQEGINVTSSDTWGTAINLTNTTATSSAQQYALILSGSANPLGTGSGSLLLRNMSQGLNLMTFESNGTVRISPEAESNLLNNTVFGDRDHAPGAKFVFANPQESIPSFQIIRDNDGLELDFEVTQFGEVLMPNVDGIASTTGYQNLYWNTTTGELGRFTSSARYKKNIRNLDFNKEKYFQLRPVNYSYKEDESNSIEVGLIAEEVDTIFPEMVIYAPSEKGNPESNYVPESVDYNKMNVYNFEILRQHQIEIDSLKNTIQILTSQLSNQKSVKQNADSKEVTVEEFELLKLKNSELEAKLQKVIDLMGTEVSNK